MSVTAHRPALIFHDDRGSTSRKTAPRARVILHSVLDNPLFSGEVPILTPITTELGENILIELAGGATDILELQTYGRSIVLRAHKTGLNTFHVTSGSTQ